MARNMAIFGVPNHASSPSTTFSTVTSGIVPAGFEASYLKTPEPSETARITSLDPAKSQWAWDLASPRTVIGLGIVNHNLVKGSSFRFIAPVGGVTYVYTTKVPNAIVSSSNITGGVTNVDETIDVPDNIYISPTSIGAGWNVNFGFGNFTDVPRTGTNLACVVIRMKRTVVTGTELYSPMVTADLYESGSFVKTLGYRAVRSTATNGQLFIFPFDFSDLALPSGVNLEIKLTCTAGVNTIGGLSSYSSLDTLNVYYESTAQYPSPFTYDSGWITVESEDPKTSINVIEPIKSDHYIPLSTWTQVTNGCLLIRSDMSTNEATLSLGGLPIYNEVPDSLEYIQAGVVPIGDGIILSIGMTTTGSGPSSGVDVEEISGTTLGGQAYGASAWRKRFIPSTTVTVTRDELLILQQMEWTRGHSNPVYIVLEPDVDRVYQKFTSFWGVIKDFGEPQRTNYFSPSGDSLYTIDLSFEEKL